MPENEVTTYVGEYNGYPVLVIQDGEYQGKPREFSLGKHKVRALLKVLDALYDFAEVPKPSESEPF